MKRALACCIVALLLFACIAPAFAASADNGDTIVYVTTYGEKYHRSTCGYLWNSSRAITLRDAVLKGYGRCARCRPPVFNGTIPTPTPKPVPTPQKTPAPSAAAQSEKQTSGSGWAVLIYVAIFAAMFFPSTPTKKTRRRRSSKKTLPPRSDSAPTVATELVYTPERPQPNSMLAPAAPKRPEQKGYTPYVYFSEHGNVYHMGWCKHAQGMCSAPLCKVGNRRPCKVCNPPRRQ